MLTIIGSGADCLGSQNGASSGADCVGSRNGAGSGAASVGSWNRAGSGAVSVGSRNEASSGADSVGSWNRAVSGADSVGSRNGAGSGADSVGSRAYLLFLLSLGKRDTASSSATPGGAALRTDISGGSSMLRLNQGYPANEREILGVADQILGTSGTADLAERQADASISSSSSLRGRSHGPPSPRSPTFSVRPALPS